MSRRRARARPDRRRVRRPPQGGKVNIDEEPEVAGPFSVRSIPTLVVVQDRKVVAATMGAAPKNALVRMLELDKFATAKEA